MTHAGRARDALAVFSIALIVRAVYFWLHTESLYFDRPILDSLWIHQWALALVAGEGSGNEAYVRAPLYPFFVSFVYRVAGAHPWAVALVQHVLGALTAVLLYRQGIRLGGRAVGWVAGMAWSFYWVALFFEGELLIVTLATFLGVVFVELLLGAGEGRRAPGRERATLALAGLALGLAAIARPNFLVLLPLAIGWPIVRLASPRTARRVLGVGLPVVAGVTLAVAPVTIRNLVVAGDLVLISSQGGINAFVGNGPDADGKTAIAPAMTGPLSRSVTASGFRDNVTTAGRQVAEAARGRALRGSEVSRYWVDRTLASMAEEPARAAGLFVRKTAYLLNGFEISDNRDLREAAAESRWTAMAFVRLSWLLPFAWLGVLWSRRHAPVSYCYVFFTLLYGFSIILFFVNARFRLPLLPAVFLLAAAGIVGLAHPIGRRLGRLRSRSPSAAGSRGATPAWVAAAVLGLGVVATNARPFQIDEHRAEATFRLNRAVLLIEAGECPAALAAFEEAVAADPARLEARFGWARALERCGDLVGAEVGFAEIVARYPDFVHGPLAHARVLEALERPAEAEQALARAVQVGSGEAEAHLRYADFLLRAGRHGAAATQYAEGLAVDPGRLKSWMNYGYTLAALDRLDEAIRAWEQVLRLDPQNRMALNNIRRAGLPRDD